MSVYEFFSQKPLPPPRFLSGWKDIAKYLGLAVRTVQRYEQTLGLPVRRPAGTVCASVMASSRELDRWASANSMKSPAAYVNSEGTHDLATYRP